MLLLAGLTALAPFSLQIFLPALPAIQAELRGHARQSRSWRSACRFSPTPSPMLAYGPLSDRFGRRPVLLVGLAAFVVGSVACALAPSIGTLIVARIVQSVGAAAGMVLARAIVRDLYDRERSASVIAYLTMAMVVAPMLAPTIGAVLIDLASWRAIFSWQPAVGVVLIWQTGRHAGRDAPAGGAPHRLVPLWPAPAPLLRIPAFLAYALQSTFAIAVFFSFIAGAPYFMIDVLGPAGDRVRAVLHPGLGGVHGRQSARRRGSPRGSGSIA